MAMDIEVIWVGRQQEFLKFRIFSSATFFPSSPGKSANGSRQCAPDDRLRASSRQTPRPSSSFLLGCSQDVDARHKAGHDELRYHALRLVLL
jgi:hypothetical protein